MTKKIMQKQLKRFPEDGDEVFELCSACGLLLLVSCLSNFLTLKMNAVCSSETSSFFKMTWR
jgi:transcription elongation factor Elf1